MHARIQTAAVATAVSGVGAAPVAIDLETIIAVLIELLGLPSQAMTLSAFLSRLNSWRRSTNQLLEPLPNGAPWSINQPIHEYG